MRTLLVAPPGSPLQALLPRLSGPGDLVLGATTLEAALEILRHEPAVDLLLLDERVGDGPPGAVARRLASLPRGEAASLLALAPAGDVARHRALLEAGAEALLLEPLDGAVAAAQLLSAQHRLARRRAGQEPSDRLQLLFAKNPNPMWFYDLDTLAFLEVNDAAVERYGWARAEFLAMTLKDIRPPEDVPRLMAAVELAGGLTTVSTTPGFRHRRKDGQVFPVEIVSHPTSFRGRPAELILALDVSEREAALARARDSEARLALSDRLASMGAMAAAVVHEINNPLTWVAANLDFAVAAMAGPAGAAPRQGEVAEALREAREGAERVSRIVRDVGLFSRGAEPGLGPVDLARVVDGALALASLELRPRAVLARDYQEVPPVLGDGSRLGQVFLNLAVNAAQAIPAGRARDHLVTVTIRREGRTAVVEVADTGVGIPPELLPRIFDPFFTTKPAGAGTGLGLAISRRLVSEMGGTIEVESVAGEGTRFRVRLPLVAEATEAARAVPPAASPAARAVPGRQRTVLVVDDEPLVGRAVARLLGAAAAVEAETSGRRALDRVSAGERFDVVLCDLAMPELSGPDFAAALARVAPEQEARLVIMSGGATGEAERAFLDRRPGRRLDKPFDAEVLRELVRRVAGG